MAHTEKLTAPTALPRSCLMCATSAYRVLNEHAVSPSLFPSHRSRLYHLPSSRPKGWKRHRRFPGRSDTAPERARFQLYCFLLLPALCRSIMPMAICTWGLGELCPAGDFCRPPSSSSLPSLILVPAPKIRVSRLVQCSRRDMSLKLKKASKREHHLWMKRDSTGSGQKALNLVHIVEKLPNEKEVIYSALDKWTAWETEFPVIAAAKALEILRKQRKWLRIIQVTKWLLSKGQVLTMGTYDTLLLAFDMDGRVDEVEAIWNIILQTHTRSVSKRLFSRMIALYDHHKLPDKILEVFADMEELGLTPDDDTVTRIGRAFETLGQKDKQDLLLKRYKNKWKHLHFNGERVRVRSSL